MSSIVVYYLSLLLLDHNYIIVMLTRGVAWTRVAGGEIIDLLVPFIRRSGGRVPDYPDGLDHIFYKNNDKNESR